MPTQKEIDRALRFADNYPEYKTVGAVLSAAYRAEKKRADTYIRQYEGLFNLAIHTKYSGEYATMKARHLFERAELK